MSNDIPGVGKLASRSPFALVALLYSRCVTHMGFFRGLKFKLKILATDHGTAAIPLY